MPNSEKDCSSSMDDQAISVSNSPEQSSCPSDDRDEVIRELRAIREDSLLNLLASLKNTLAGKTATNSSRKHSGRSKAKKERMPSSKTTFSASESDCDSKRN